MIIKKNKKNQTDDNLHDASGDDDDDDDDDADGRSRRVLDADGGDGILCVCVCVEFGGRPKRRGVPPLDILSVGLFWATGLDKVAKICTVLVRSASALP